MCDKNKVYYSYFIEHKSVSEIAKEENVSQPAITKILKQFPEYLQEKERRKAENKEKHKQKTIEYIKEKRAEIKKSEKEEREEIIQDFFDNVQAIDYIDEYIEDYLCKKYNKDKHEIRFYLIGIPLYEKIEKSRESSTVAGMDRLHQIELRKTLKRKKLGEQALYEACQSSYEYNFKTQKMDFTGKHGAKPYNLKSSYSVHTFKTGYVEELQNDIEAEKRTSSTEKKALNL